MVNFWTVVETQRTELESANTADDVLRILAQDRNPYGPGCSSAPGFFAGDGDDVYGALVLKAGWHTVWSKASYHYCLRASDGSMITYVEGDVYPGNPENQR